MRTGSRMRIDLTRTHSRAFRALHNTIKNNNMDTASSRHAQKV